jgi:hypothetical protein
MANSKLSLKGGSAGAKPWGRRHRHWGTALQAKWHEPYLETCCRSALHRLTLVGGPGRPDGLKDGPCLERLLSMGLARRRPADGRFEITAEGEARHAWEVLKKAG